MRIEAPKEFVDLSIENITLTFLIDYKTSKTSFHELLGQCAMLAQTEIATQRLLVNLQLMDPAVAPSDAEQSSFQHHQIAAREAKTSTLEHAAPVLQLCLNVAQPWISRKSSQAVLTRESDKQTHLIYKFRYSLSKPFKFPQLPRQKLMRMRDLILNVVDIQIPLSVTILDPALKLRPHLPCIFDLFKRVVYMLAVQF